MKQTTTPAAAVLCLAALAAALTACGGGANKPAPAASAAAAEEKKGEHGEKGGLKLSEEEAKRAGIRVEELRMQTVADTLTVTATVRPNQDRVARVAPRVEGRITGVSTNLGDRVRAGQALATLDSLVIGEAHSALLQAQAANRVAQADFKRAEALNADEIIAQKDFLRARADHEKSGTELRAAQDKLRLLGVSPDASGTRAQSTFAVVAPFAGTVIQKKATMGDLATPSEPLFTIADLSKVWVEASLPEAALAKVRSGAAATVTVSAYPGERFTGRVAYLAPCSTRTPAAWPPGSRWATRTGASSPRCSEQPSSKPAATHAKRSQFRMPRSCCCRVSRRCSLPSLAATKRGRSNSARSWVAARSSSRVWPRAIRWSPPGPARSKRACSSRRSATSIDATLNKRTSHTQCHR